MKAFSFALLVTGVAFGVLLLVFRNGFDAFTTLPETEEWEAVDGAGGSEGPSRRSLKAWEAELENREAAVASREALADRGRQLAGLRPSLTRVPRPATPDDTLVEADGDEGLGSTAEDPLSDLEVIERAPDENEEEEVLLAESTAEEEYAAAEVDPYPAAYVDGNRGATPGFAPPAGGDGRVPLTTEIPEAMFEGTKVPLKLANLEPIEIKQKPLMVPPGLVNLASGRPVTSSNDLPIIGDLEFVTDGDKDAADGSYVELGPQLQWVQIDLGDLYELHGLWVWHFHKSPRAYVDVVVQISADPEFNTGREVTIYNADHDDSLGFGRGRNKAYVDTNLGRVMNAHGLAARYVRLYSSGNTSNEMNHYTEVEVWGRGLQP